MEKEVCLDSRYSPASMIGPYYLSEISTFRMFKDHYKSIQSPQGVTMEWLDMVGLTQCDRLQALDLSNMTRVSPVKLSKVLLKLDKLEHFIPPTWMLQNNMLRQFLTHYTPAMMPNWRWTTKAFLQALERMERA